MNEDNNAPEPTFTQTPNSLYDRIQRLIDPYAFSILSVIVRKTYGFQKRRDNISNSQIEYATGFERPTVTKYAKNLERLRLIKSKRKPGFTPEYSFGDRFLLIDDLYLRRQLRQREEKRKQQRGETPFQGDGNDVSREGETLFPGGGKRGFHTKENLNKPSKQKIKNAVADAPPALFKQVIDLIGKAHLHLTGEELSWIGKEKAYGSAVKNIIKSVSRETSEENQFKIIRQKCAAYVSQAGKDDFLKKQGVTPLSILSNWNKLHYKPNMLNGSFGAQKKPFPNYRAMSPDEITAAFTGWKKHWNEFDLKENISPESYQRFTQDAGGFSGALPGILIEEVHKQKKTA
jgi:hypothetical protein